MSVVDVVALGGSLLRPEEAEAREQWFGRLRQLVVHLEGNGRKIAFVVGGGLPAREGILLAKATIRDPQRLDEIGIAGTRLNATILQQLLLEIGCDVAPSIPHSTAEAKQLLEQYHVVVMGGTVPGHTTDTVAVRLAVEVGARNCIIATNVSHVYSKDPRHHPDAEAITELTLEELAKITGIGTPLEPGASAVIDPVAVKDATEARLQLAVLDGRDLLRLDDALEGKWFEGTIIRP